MSDEFGIQGGTSPDVRGTIGKGVGPSLKEAKNPPSFELVESCPGDPLGCILGRNSRCQEVGVLVGGGIAGDLDRGGMCENDTSEKDLHSQKLAGCGR